MKHKILWKFEIETVYRIRSRKQDLSVVNKRVHQGVNFAVPVDTVNLEESENISRRDI